MRLKAGLDETTQRVEGLSANQLPLLPMASERWERLWDDARIIRDCIEEWLAYNGIPSAIVFIREVQPLHPKPCVFTFVYKVGVVYETTVVSAIELHDNSNDIALFAQIVADSVYEQLIEK